MNLLSDSTALTTNDGGVGDDHAGGGGGGGHHISKVAMVEQLLSGGGSSRAQLARLIHHSVKSRDELCAQIAEEMAAASAAAAKSSSSLTTFSSSEEISFSSSQAKKKRRTMVEEEATTTPIPSPSCSSSTSPLSDKENKDLVRDTPFLLHEHINSFLDEVAHFDKRSNIWTLKSELKAKWGIADRIHPIFLSSPSSNPASSASPSIAASTRTPAGSSNSKAATTPKASRASMPARNSNQQQLARPKAKAKSSISGPLVAYSPSPARGNEVEEEDDDVVMLDDDDNGAEQVEEEDEEDMEERLKWKNGIMSNVAVLVREIRSPDEWSKMVEEDRLRSATPQSTSSRSKRERERKKKQKSKMSKCRSVVTGKLRKKRMRNKLNNNDSITMMARTSSSSSSSKKGGSGAPSGSRTTKTISSFFKQSAGTSTRLSSAPSPAIYKPKTSTTSTAKPPPPRLSAVEQRRHQLRSLAKRIQKALEAFDTREVTREVKHALKELLPATSTQLKGQAELRHQTQLTALRKLLAGGASSEQQVAHPLVQHLLTRELLRKMGVAVKKRKNAAAAKPSGSGASEIGSSSTTTFVIPKKRARLDDEGTAAASNSNSGGSAKANNSSSNADAEAKSEERFEALVAQFLNGKYEDLLAASKNTASPLPPLPAVPMLPSSSLTVDSSQNTSSAAAGDANGAADHHSRRRFTTCLVLTEWLHTFAGMLHLPQSYSALQLMNALDDEGEEGFRRCTGRVLKAMVNFFMSATEVGIALGRRTAKNPAEAELTGRRGSNLANVYAHVKLILGAGQSQSPNKKMGPQRPRRQKLIGESEDEGEDNEEAVEKGGGDGEADMNEVGQQQEDAADGESPMEMEEDEVVDEVEDLRRALLEAPTFSDLSPKHRLEVLSQMVELICDSEPYLAHMELSRFEKGRQTEERKELEAKLFTLKKEIEEEEAKLPSTSDEALALMTRDQTRELNRQKRQLGEKQTEVDELEERAMRLDSHLKELKAMSGHNQNTKMRLQAIGEDRWHRRWWFFPHNSPNRGIFVEEEEVEEWQNETEKGEEKIRYDHKAIVAKMSKLRSRMDLAERLQFDLDGWPPLRLARQTTLQSADANKNASKEEDGGGSVRWYCISKRSQYHAVVAALNSRGVREEQLLRRMRAMEEQILASLAPDNDNSGGNNGGDEQKVVQLCGGEGAGGGDGAAAALKKEGSSASGTAAAAAAAGEGGHRSHHNSPTPSCEAQQPKITLAKALLGRRQLGRPRSIDRGGGDGDGRTKEGSVEEEKEDSK